MRDPTQSSTCAQSTTLRIQNGHICLSTQLSLSSKQPTAALLHLSKAVKAEWRSAREVQESLSHASPAVTTTESSERHHL